MPYALPQSGGPIIPPAIASCSQIRQERVDRRAKEAEKGKQKAATAVTAKAGLVQSTLSFAPKPGAKLAPKPAPKLAEKPASSDPAPPAITAGLIDQLDDIVDTIVQNLMHPLDPAPADVQLWNNLTGSPVRRKQVALMGMDGSTAEELFIKYGGHGALASRRDLFHLLYVLKRNPSYDGAAWEAHASISDDLFWERLWRTAEQFNAVCDELQPGLFSFSSTKGRGRHMGLSWSKIVLAAL